VIVSILAEKHAHQVLQKNSGKYPLHNKTITLILAKE